MKYMTLIILFFCIYANSQEIKYDETNKLPDFIIVESKGSKEDLYKKSINWINKTYKNPELVIMAKTENELIKFNGSCIDCLIMNLIPNKTLQYIITLEFKDDKYKFELSNVTFDNDDDLKDGNIAMFKENGKLRGQFKDYPKIIEDVLNNVFNSLKEHIGNEKEDW